MRLLLLFLLFFVLPSGGWTARAQSGGYLYEAGLSAAGGTEGRLPFWLHANRYGVYDQDSANLLTRVGVTRPFTGRHPIDVRFRVEAVAHASRHASAYLHEWYGQVRYGALTLTAGRIARASTFVDTTLSMGDVTLSPNAPPIPRLSVDLDYIPIVRISGIELLHLKAYFSHGFLEGDRFVRHPFLHEKYLYLRGFGPEDFPVLGHAGITHYVIWGGTHPTLGPLPSGPADFLDVVFAQSGDEDRAPIGEVVNALGNTIASYDFGLTLNLPGFDFKAYRQFYIETGANTRFRSVWDGLWGFVFRLKAPDRPLRAVLFEVADMRQQNARFELGERKGRANYYNNFIYEAGWTYEGRTLGLPLLVADGRHPGVVNNIVLAHHLGLEGRIAGFDYRALGTYSRNYGANRACIDEACTAKADARIPRTDQYSLLLEVTGRLDAARNLDFRLGMAYDSDGIYPENAGVLFGLSWRGRTPTGGLDGR